MDFGLAFSYVFKDTDWFKKVGIVALISLIPIIGQLVVLGWGLQIAKRVMDKHPVPLPDVDFGGDLGRGFSGFIIGFVYALPVSIISTIFAGIDSFVSTQTSSDGLAAIIVVVSICFGLFAIIYGFALALVLPAAYGNFLAKGTLSAGFNLSQVFGLVRANIGAYLIVLLGYFVAGLIAPLGTIACIIGVIITYTYSVAVTGHLYGQAYNEATKNQALAAA